MVTFMGTFNGMRHSGLDFFITHHWIYPLIACVALLLRLELVGRFVDYLAPKIIFPHFKGVARTVAMTCLNIVVMAPIMTCVTTLLLYGTDHYWFNVWDNLPISMLVSFFVNLFIVAPTVKMLYNRLVNTERGMRWLGQAEGNALPWMAIFNS
ncbi:MAG: DUF2798 domain-containing protein [Eggerthellaceae bacterium]|nr:DUF2798 domain-containing protein [Eggerthellaceae bacterium]